MSDWKNQAEVAADVVYFNYLDPEEQKIANEVFVWDVDKTYLDTKFESLSGLWKTIAEKAFQKRNVPGTAVLVQALKESWGERKRTRKFVFFFITASPPQLEKRIREKLEIDGIHPAGIYFKDNLRNLRPGRLWRLTKQVGFKVQALLQMRLRLHPNVRQIMWGDDSEQDAVIYSLYSDICSRRQPREELERVLNYFFVTGQQIDDIFSLQELIPANDPVDKIYINLADDTDAEYYQKFGKRVVPTYNTLQTALDLFQDGRLSMDQVMSVGLDLKTNFNFSPEELERSFDDLIRRQVLNAKTVAELQPVLIDTGLLTADFAPSVTPVSGDVAAGETHADPWIPEVIDYLHDYR